MNLPFDVKKALRMLPRNRLDAKFKMSWTPYEKQEWGLSSLRRYKKMIFRPIWIEGREIVYMRRVV